MISKNSFVKMVLYDIRERSAWLLAAFLVFLLSLPVRSLIRMDSINVSIEEARNYGQYVTRAFKASLGYDNSAVLVAVIAVAFFLGFSGFWYLYSREKTDFYHSLPQRREKLFAVPYISGILIFVIPYALNIVLSFAAGAVKGAVTGECVLVAAGTFFTYVVFFLLFYHLAILAVVLTGNLFTGVMGFGAFLTYSLIVNEAFISLTQKFFLTTVYGEMNGGNWLSIWRFSVHMNDSGFSLSPLVQCIYTVMGISESGNAYFNAGGVAKSFLLAAVLGVICVLVYRIRPSESHNKAIAFPKFEPVIKVAVTLPVAVLIGLAISNSMGEHNFAWFVGTVLFAGAVLLAAMQFLYSMDLRNCLKLRISTGVAFGGLILIIVVFRFDVFGMDTYLPAKDKVESMSVYINELNGLYSYSSESAYNRGNSAMAYLDNAEYTDFEDIYVMAQRGAEYQGSEEQENQDYQMKSWAEELTLVEYSSEIMDEEPRTLDYYVKYNLKSGREVYRFYSLPQNEELLSCVKNLYNSWEFKEKTLPVEFLEAEDISGILMQDMYSSERRVDLSDEEKKDFYNMYKSEWEALTFDEMQTNRVVAFVTFSQRLGNEGRFYDTYVMSTPIYEKFEKSIQLLEKAGFHIYSAEDTDKIENVTVTVENEGETKEYTFTEEKDIKEVLEKSQFERYGNYLGGARKNYNMSVRIQWKDETQMYAGSLYLTYGELPACLEKAMNTD